MPHDELPPAPRPRRLLLLGPPGVGKGTQGTRLAERYQARHVSTGDLLREQIAAGTELGEQAQPFMDRGDLVPDELVLGMVLDDVLGPTSPESYVLDGFPRTVAQAQAAYEHAVASERVLDAVISLELELDELVRRLELRAQDEGRADDDDETVRHRIEEYEQKTRPLLGYYDGRDILLHVPATGAPDEVFERIYQAVEDHVRR